MTISLLRQPIKSSQCGQHCLAMLTNHPVEEIIELIGTPKGTTTKQIVSALTQLGFSHSEKLVIKRKQPFPDVAICKIRRENVKSGNWHWVLLYKGNIYDSDPFQEAEQPCPVETYMALLTPRNQKLTSYIEINEKE